MRIRYEASAIDDLEQIRRYHVENAGSDVSERFVKRILTEGRTVYVVRILHGHRDIRPPLTSLLVAV